MSSFFARSGSIASSSAMWRKESVTIIERAEDVDEDDENVKPEEEAIPETTPNAGKSKEGKTSEAKVTVQEPKADQG